MILCYILIAILAIGCVGYILHRVYRTSNLSFWKLAAKFPDLAFDWFMAEECWVVRDGASPNSGPPEPKGAYSGPFFLRVPKLGGRLVRVYGKHSEIEASQERFKARIARRKNEIEQYLQAAQAGDANAQFEVGVLHQYGRGVSQDYAEAARYYRKAAEQGHSGAQSNLGILYSMGQGVLRDNTEALKWFTRAADQGDPYAQNNLARMYSFGTGLSQDYTKAYMWIILAIRGLEGPEKEKAKLNRDMFLAKHMTAEEIDRAQRMAADWLARHK